MQGIPVESGTFEESPLGVGSDGCALLGSTRLRICYEQGLFRVIPVALYGENGGVMFLIS